MSHVSTITTTTTTTTSTTTAATTATIVYSSLLSSPDKQPAPAASKLVAKATSPPAEAVTFSGIYFFLLHLNSYFVVLFWFIFLFIMSVKFGTVIYFEMFNNKLTRNG